MENKYNNFKELINQFYETIVNDGKNEDDINRELKGKIKIEPKVIFEDISNNLKIEFYITLKNKSYKIKNLSEFYMLFLKHEKYKYADSLEFIHEEEVFEEESKDILNFLLKYAELSKSIKDSMNIGKKYLGKDINNSSIILTPNAIDELFYILENKWIQMEKQGIDEVVQFIKQNPDVKFKISKVNEEEYKIFSTIDKKSKYYLVNGANFSYMLLEDKLYQYDEAFENTTLKILEVLRKNLKKEIVFSKNQAELLFGIVVPNIDGKVICKVKELEQYIPQKLNVKLYLDYDKTDNITCNVKFKYGEIEFNPLKKDLNIKIPRNVAEETEVFNTFMQIGFLLDTKNLKFVLQETEKIYKFLVEDIFELKNKFEVLVSNTFKNKQIKPLKINSVGVKIENNLLEIDLSKMDINPLEIMNIMQDYKLKKKYYRLIDGSFLELQNSTELEFINSLIDDFDLDYQDIRTGHLKISKSRALYLDKILKNLENTNIITDSNYKAIINDITQAKEKIEIPENLQIVLRDYQKKGYEWLKTLEQYGFSGILADDMGLGKTIQILSIIVSYVENNNKTKPSLVVAPSSLVLNWKKETEKFAKNIKILLINGKQEERHRNIKNINKYDLIITSYDLLKRDIEIYKEMNYEFKYMIADEAQYIKNENTQNAKSMKQINAENRFALTGTPIENSLSELWSIFDYIMPGYLFSYRKFKQNYELPIVIEKNEKVMEHLKMLIEPFILRRTKKQVLTELPEKNVAILNNEMTDEQRKIYLSYLSQAKTELKEQIDSYGFEKTRIRILALLTRLRQICCYPGLFIENYENESGKLAQCMELVKQAIASNHKILLFSGYTSMLEVIEDKLRKEDISYFKLTGQTKLDERMRLVEEFNNYDETKVFLISLKAGGTGLNLTGADIVIHYDPWWNISVENQATDRAYRIGQKKNVQVYKLITKNSIEEKMYNLQQRKAELIDNVLDTNTTFINKLSKEEIMGLFEE